MFPVLQLLIALALALMAPGFEHWLPLNAVRTPLYTVATVLLIIPIGMWLIARIRQDVRRWDAGVEGWERLARMHFRVAGRFRLLPILLFLFVCLGVGWPQLIARGPLGNTILLDELAAVAPFLALLVLSWVLQYRMDQAVSRRCAPLSRYLKFQVRQVMLPVAPMIVMITLLDLLRNSATAERQFTTFPFLMEAVVIGVLTLIYLLSGPLMRLFFNGERLPDGPLRERLEAYSAHVGFRCRDFLIWHTGLNLINAAIVGGMPRLRYVLFTEGMLASFTDEEIEAVLAHEVGHAKGRHIHLYFAFAITLIFLTGLAREACASWLPAEVVRHDYFELGLFITVVVVYWRLIFGFVSRKFEREADFFGASSLGDHRRFIDTLEEVARKSGTLRTLPSWRHYSIAERSDFLRDAFQRPEVAERFRRAVRRVKVGVVLVLGCSMLLAMRDVGPQYRAGRRFFEALGHIEASRYADARRTLQAALDDESTRPHLISVVASHSQGRWSGYERLLLADTMRLAGAQDRAFKALNSVLSAVTDRLRAGDVAGAREALRPVVEYARFWGPIKHPDSWRSNDLFLQLEVDRSRRLVRLAERGYNPLFRR